MNILFIDQHTPEWHEFRKKHIGSSDIAAIMGKSPWKSAYDVWEEKMGIAKKRYQSHAMKQGLIFEPLARKVFERDYNVNLEPLCVQNGVFCASCDGVDLEQQCLLEIKVPANGIDHIERPDPYYLLQVQWQMMLLGYPMGNLMYFDTRTELYKNFFTVKNPVLWEEMTQKGIEFWQMVQQGIPPECNKRIKESSLISMDSD